ncbi:MAG: ABC transporter ATP-binding protein [Gemmatimonadetes bacterium]|jgi:ATP-binding cassette subfamily B protein|nr:ABC transporter ATP-binding protein [Gemmatimonadota bacterium]MBT4612093.1 ABC transporter ATP-binding protein [Gemmatimonadota bacterium]MBT5056382.1 ABC transporter ATP-binding protein [Gemmatimonadota bacterium]MBT5145152.1 ABC transporter ATP-binding protein [Gemmatimonadota bacterium]MBT5586966.1 ABC transporter ATP-binding protein [Gemmatimonadota bacterium]
MTTTTIPPAAPLLEDLPLSVGRRLAETLDPAEASVIQVATDMADRHTFAAAWLVVTDRRVLLLPATATADTASVVSVDLRQVRTARAEPLVGGGRLGIERLDGATLSVYYSNTLAPKFAEVSECLKQLAGGESPDLPTQIERTRCERCHRILPEKDGVCPACLRKLDTLGRLLRYMFKYPWRMMGLLTILLLETMADLVPPIITQYIIDDVLIPQANLPLLGWLVLVLLAVNVLRWVTWVSRRWVGTWVGFRAIEQLRADLYKAFQYLPLRFYDKRRVGGLISRMSNDSDLVEIYLIFDMPYVINNFLMVVFILGYLSYLSWELTLWVLLPVPPILIGSALIWKRMEAYWQRWSAKWSRLSSHLNESIRGIRIVKAFAQEQRESSRFDRRNAELRDVSVSAERTWVVFWMVTNFLMSFGVFFVWYFGGQQVLHQDLTPGELMTFITFIWMLYQPLKWFGDFYGFMMRAYAGAERIFEVIDARREPFDKPEATPIPKIDGAVEFDGAFFGYDPGKPVLKDADLVVKPGEMIGLVGRSGAGKSTLIQLICRFYDVTRGRLRIDGIDIRDIRLEDLRSQIGLVAQQSFLFNGSIAQNIAYGKPGASFDDVLRAAHAANAHEFIVKKPDGYDMIVGEQGNKLSGGERQRLAIARAILHDPRILILDEATSSLDTPTEKKIQEAIARLVQGRTTFAIAHRLSTLRSADRIVVLEQGRIVEVGTHTQLMERQGFFYKLVKTQQASTGATTTGATTPGD